MQTVMNKKYSNLNITKHLMF